MTTLTCVCVLDVNSSRWGLLKLNLSENIYLISHLIHVLQISTLVRGASISCAAAVRHLLDNFGVVYDTHICLTVLAVSNCGVVAVLVASSR